MAFPALGNSPHNAGIFNAINGDIYIKWHVVVVRHDRDNSCAFRDSRHVGT